MADIAAGTIESMAKVYPNLVLTSHILSLSLHGHLVGGTFTDFIKSFAGSPPEGMNPLIGQGVVFYFGPEAARLSTSVVLDASGAVQGGLFVKLQAGYDGQRVGAHELKDVAIKDFTEMFARFGLEPSWASS